MTRLSFFFFFTPKLTWQCWRRIRGGESKRNERSGPQRHTVSVIDNGPDSDIPVIWLPVQEDKTSNQTQHFQRPLHRTRSDKQRPGSVQAARMNMRHGHHSSMCSSTHGGHIHDVSRQDYEGRRQCSLDPLSQWFPTFSSQQPTQSFFFSQDCGEFALCIYLFFSKFSKFCNLGVIFLTVKHISESCGSMERLCKVYKRYVKVKSK